VLLTFPLLASLICNRDPSVSDVAYGREGLALSATDGSETTIVNLVARNT
jgi:hypothetical protein